MQRTDFAHHGSLSRLSFLASGAGCSIWLVFPSMYLLAVTAVPAVAACTMVQHCCCWCVITLLPLSCGLNVAKFLGNSRLYPPPKRCWPPLVSSANAIGRYHMHVGALFRQFHVRTNAHSSRNLVTPCVQNRPFFQEPETFRRKKEIIDCKTAASGAQFSNEHRPKTRGSLLTLFSHHPGKEK